MHDKWVDCPNSHNPFSCINARQVSGLFQNSIPFSCINSRKVSELFKKSIPFSCLLKSQTFYSFLCMLCAKNQQTRLCPIPYIQSVKINKQILFLTLSSWPHFFSEFDMTILFLCWFWLNAEKSRVMHCLFIDRNLFVLGRMHSRIRTFDIWVYPLVEVNTSHKAAFWAVHRTLMEFWQIPCWKHPRSKPFMAE